VTGHVTVTLDVIALCKYNIVGDSSSKGNICLYRLKRLTIHGTVARLDLKPVRGYNKKTLYKGISEDFMRLQKYLAECGVASRRASETLIRDGKVKVNGQTVQEMGVQIDPEKDVISLDGHTIKSESKSSYFLFYKPRGVVSTLSDENGRKCIASYFKQYGKRLYPVGRLDMDSEGLLIVTDDGEYANRVMHPKFGVEKEYRVTVDKPFSSIQAEKLITGVDIGENNIAKADQVSYQNRPDGRSIVVMTLSQGKNREIRRMLESMGFLVLLLKRTRIGLLTIENMKPGEIHRVDRDTAQQVFPT
jgi:23S rRNA pseudouridine2605 synthase